MISRDEPRPVPRFDEESERKAKENIAALGIPKGSLGIIHELGCKLAGIAGDARPKVDKAATIVFCGDHGIAIHGVSCFPKQVTWANMKKMVEGTATISAFAKTLNSDLCIVDIGVDGPRLDIECNLPGNQTNAEYIYLRTRNGTRDFTSVPALTADEVTNAINSGHKVVSEKIGSADIIVFGEMGIGNTSSAAALCSALLSVKPEKVTGPGTGLDHEGLQRKIRLIEQAISRVNDIQRTTLSPWRVLEELGGLEIAGIVGGMLAAAEMRRPVLLDGFVVGAAALVAERMFPGISKLQIAGSVSAEPGHKYILEELHLRPLLQFEMRLGEGSAAILGVPILRAAATQFREIGTLDSLIEEKPC